MSRDSGRVTGIGDHQMKLSHFHFYFFWVKIAVQQYLSLFTSNIEKNVISMTFDYGMAVGARWGGLGIQ